MLVVEAPRPDLEKPKAKTVEDDLGVFRTCTLKTDDFSLHTPQSHGSPQTKHGPGTGGGHTGMPTSTRRIRRTCFRAGMFAGGRATRSKVRALAFQAAYNAGVGSRILESHLQDVFGRGVEEGRDYLATVQLDVMFRRAWRSCHTRCDGLMRFQPGTPFLAQRQALDTLIRQVREGLTSPLLDWSKSAFNLMQSEINAYKVAVVNYSNGFLAVQDQVKRLVGWEFSRCDTRESACYFHFCRLVNRHAPWQPHIRDETAAPCPTCTGNQLVHAVLDMFAGTYPWVPPQDRERAHYGDNDDGREQEEEEEKHEAAAGETEKVVKKRGRKPASAPYVDDRSPKKRRQAEVFARAVGFRVVLNRMWQDGGRVHHKQQKDGSLVEIRPPTLCLVPHVRQSARMITLDARDIAVLTGKGIPRAKASASAKGKKRGRDGEAIASHAPPEQPKAKPPKLRLWELMLPETWERVQFYRSMRRKLEMPGSPWGHPTSIRTNGYIVQVLFPKRDPDAGEAGALSSHCPIHMHAIEDVAPLQGRQVVGLDPGEVHIVANDTGGVLTKEQYYGAKSMPRASNRDRMKRDPGKPRRKTRVPPPLAAEAIRQAAPPQSGGIRAILAFATTHADIAKVYCSPYSMRRRTHDARCEQVRDKRIGGMLDDLAPPGSVVALGANYHGRRARRGDKCTPVFKSIIRRLPTATRPVILVDEFNTSKKCCECHSLMQSIGRAPSGKPLRETQCSNQACPRSKLDNGRDTNAAINIKLVLDEFLAGRSRPAYLCRGP